MPQAGEKFGAGFLAVSPIGRRIVAWVGLKGDKTVGFVAGNRQITETRTAGIAVDVDFGAELHLRLRLYVVRQDAVERMVVSAGTRQVVAAVVADEYGAAAQGVVGIQRAVGIGNEAVMLPRTCRRFQNGKRFGLRFFALQGNHARRFAEAAVGQAAGTAHHRHLFVKRAVEIVGAAAYRIAFIKEFRRAVHADAVDGRAARRKLAVARGIVAHFAVVHAGHLFQNVLQRIEPLVVNLLFGDDGQRLRRFALGQPDAGGNRRSGHGVIGCGLFADAVHFNRSHFRIQRFVRTLSGCGGISGKRQHECCR